MRSAKLHSVRISDKETLEWSSAPEAQRESARDVERLAYWLDSIIEIPGIRLRFGLDALLGLLPGLGDTASALAAIDLTVGAIPFVGDLFDVYWKANRRNVELLRRHFQATPRMERKLKRGDTVFVASII